MPIAADELIAVAKLHGVEFIHIQVRTKTETVGFGYSTVSSL